MIDFFRISCGQLTTLQFFDVKEITLEDLRMTVGQCPQLEVLVFQECSIVPDWRSHSLGNHIKVISCSVDHLQMFGLQILPSQVRGRSLTTLARFCQLLTTFSLLKLVKEFLYCFEGKSAYR